MTILNNTFDDKAALKELLIKNLPSKIHASNEKAAFKFEPVKTIEGLRYDFISFNSKSRVTFMIFDIDYVGETTAKEHFESIDNLLEQIMFVVGMEPTYICITNKGFQFAYHVSNPIFMHQPKAVAYLNAIKNAINDKLWCDAVASGRNYGIFRNPLKHNHYFSNCINYKLGDFKHLLSNSRPSIANSRTAATTVNIEDISVGNRNNGLFELAMHWAKNKNNIATCDIGAYLHTINSAFTGSPLPLSEIECIARSVYKYWEAGTIRFGLLSICENAGAMNFPKIRNVSRDEYVELVKERQRLSAERTNSLLTKEEKQNSMANARLARTEQIRAKIEQAISKCQADNIKPTQANLAKFAGVDRKSVRRYFCFE